MLGFHFVKWMSNPQLKTVSTSRRVQIPRQMAPDTHGAFGKLTFEGRRTVATPSPIYIKVRHKYLQKIKDTKEKIDPSMAS